MSFELRFSCKNVSVVDFHLQITRMTKFNYLECVPAGISGSGSGNSRPGFVPVPAALPPGRTGKSLSGVGGTVPSTVPDCTCTIPGFLCHNRQF